MTSTTDDGRRMGQGDRRGKPCREAGGPLMIIVVAVIIAVDIMRMTGADLRRLIDVPIKHLWMIWLALAIQVVVLWLLADHVTGWVGDVGHMVTCALAGVFAYVNRRVPGVLIMCAGEGLNLIAT